MWRDLKYLIAYIAPISAWIGFTWGGWWSPGSMYVAFILIPICELFLPTDAGNIAETEEASRLKKRFFDVLLWMNVPILYFLLYVYLVRVTTGGLTVGELVGMLFNMGLIIGVSGINVGHELGHRPSLFDRFMAWTLLLPAFYLHFYIEHNRGHHRWVATDRDPASARRGEWIYAFWLRSILGSWWSAWRLEAQRLQIMNKPTFHPGNQMILIHIVQGIYLGLIYVLWGGTGVLFCIGVSLGGHPVAGIDQLHRTLRLASSTAESWAL